MPLEATMFCLDNSGYMRNGDYHPTRLASQMDAVSRLAEAKINGNPESTVGFLTMAGDRVDVHVSPTRDIGKFLTCLKSLTPSGECDLITGIKIAQLTLKNRPNRSHRPRIILFVGSPVEAQEQELISLGNQLKKNNMALDIIHFGTENSSNSNEQILTNFLNSVQNKSNCHLVTVPPGPHGLAQMVIQSPILGNDRPASFTGRGAVGAAGAAGAGDDAMGEFADDPELLAALRASMELAEQQSLQQATSASMSAGAPAAGSSATPAAGSSAAGTSSANTDAASLADMGLEDDPELLAAIAMSLQTNAQEDAQQATNTQTQQTTSSEAKQDNAAAPASSSSSSSSSAPAPKSEEEQLEDPAFMSALLADAGYDASFLDDEDTTAKDKDKDKNGKQ